jgi:hypothetical protein
MARLLGNQTKQFGDRRLGIAGFCNLHLSGVDPIGAVRREPDARFLHLLEWEPSPRKAEPVHARERIEAAEPRRARDASDGVTHRVVAVPESLTCLQRGPRFFDRLRHGAQDARSLTAPAEQIGSYGAPRLVPVARRRPARVTLVTLSTPLALTCR